MILVDEQIKLLCNAGMLIKEGYDEHKVQSISYDLSISYIISKYDSSNNEFIHKNKEAKTINHYLLRPGETVYIKADIFLSLPNNIVGIIQERNSVMRTGLEVTGPCYQPGHETNIFLRVHNISAKEINIYKGLSIAQIMFQHLDMSPATPYNKTYQNETEYLGVQGDIKMDWCSQLERYNSKINDLENLETRIYGNILSLMGILISILALIIFNFGTLSSGNYEISNIICANLSIGLVITALLGITTLILNKRRTRSYVFYGFLLLILIIANIISWKTCYTQTPDKVSPPQESTIFSQD